MSKEQFWRLLSEPTEHTCDNCKWQSLFRSGDNIMECGKCWHNDDQQGRGIQHYKFWTWDQIK